MKDRKKRKQKRPRKRRHNRKAVAVLLDNPPLPPAISVASPQDKPVLARHRVVRCERCRTYLCDLFLKRCDPGTRASVLVTLKCRNKSCRRANQVDVDLVNEDPSKR